MAPLQIDLSTYDGVEELYADISGSGRPVDALMLNAGVGSGGGFVETDLRKELDLIALNVTSTVHLMDDTRAGSNEKLQDDSAEVAEQGFKALMDGEEKVVAGNPMNKVMAAAGRLTPDSVKAATHKILSKPGSGD